MAAASEAAFGVTVVMVDRSLYPTGRLVLRYGRFLPALEGVPGLLEGLAAEDAGLF